MRASRWLPLLAVGGVLATWIAGQAQQRGEPPRFVLTDKDAYLLANPELAAAPRVLQAAISADGRFALAVRLEGPPPPLSNPGPTGEISLVLWKGPAHRTQELWKKPARAGIVTGIAWLPGTSVGLAELQWGQPVGDRMAVRRVLLGIDGLRSSARALTELASAEHFVVSPSQPLAALQDSQKRTFRIVRASGSVGPAIPLPAGSGSVTWAADGSLLLHTWEPAPGPDHRSTAKWYAVELGTGAFRPLPGAVPASTGGAAALPLRLKPSTLVLKEEGVTQRVRPLWLESAGNSAQPRALVCADSDWAQLAPNGGAILYRSQGAAWVAALVRVPKEPFLQARRAALQAEAVSRGKQIGTALMMYVQDYDERLPPADGVVRRIMPYLKNEEFFNTPGTDTPGFVYLQDSVALATFKEPSKTRLGYLAGPDGVAVIYVDGHVEWQDRSPP